MKRIAALFVALLLAAGCSYGATVTLKGNGASCAFSELTLGADGNVAVTCAAIVTPVVPGGGPPAPPPIVTSPVPSVVVVDPCAGLPPSTRAYCRSPATGPAPGAGSPIIAAPSSSNADYELVAPGAHPIRNAGNGVYNMPAVPAGQVIEVSVQGGFGDGLSGVMVTIRDPLGNVIKNSRNGRGPELFEGGYGIIVFVAPISGNYTVEVSGGGSLTTLNHQRR